MALGPRLLALALIAGCASAPERLDLEDATAGRLLSDLDVSSFRNSTGPRRAPSQRTLSDLGVAVTRASSDRAEARSGDWLYVLEVVGRGDANRDGVPDVTVCFRDRALEGAYDTHQALLLQRVGDRVVALRFEPDYECPDP